MILEGIVTTRNADGSAHIAPMGPEIDADWQTLVLKPYQTSTTFQNLRRSGEGVFHVTDDVELIARAAVGELATTPELIATEAVSGWRLADACRWYAFRVESLDDSQPRTRIAARVVAAERQRDFYGFNRARHAVVEAAILATRVRLLPADEIFGQLAVWRPLVAKTGGPAEKRAWNFLEEYIRRCLPPGGPVPG